jgi:hypothetical protein
VRPIPDEPEIEVQGSITVPKGMYVAWKDDKIVAWGRISDRPSAPRADRVVLHPDDYERFDAYANREGATDATDS